MGVRFHEHALSMLASSMMASLHETSVEGSTVTFKFDGTRVAIRCLISGGLDDWVKASIQIADGPPVIQSQTPANDDQWQSVFSESDVLSSGPHTLTITNLRASLILDSIDYEPVPSSTPSAGLAGNTSTSIFATSTLVSPTTLSSNSSPLDSFPTAALLTGVIVAGMLVFILLVYYFLQPIRKHNKLRKLEEASLNDTLYEPKVKRSTSLSACALKKPEPGSPFAVTSTSLPPYELTDAQRSYTVKGRRNVARCGHSLPRHEHFTRAVMPPSGRASRSLPCFPPSSGEDEHRMHGETRNRMTCTVRHS